MRNILLVALAVAAPAGAQQLPTVRLINLPDASSPHIFGQVVAVRQLPSGQLLANDTQNRQLVLLSPVLAPSVIVADSASGSPSSYGTSAGGLIPYLADSTLFIDPAGLSMFVIGPTGAIVRVASVPRSQDARSLASNTQASPALDAMGRIVYRGALGRGILPATQGKTFAFPDPPDSMPIVRIDLASRKLDTAVFFKIAKTKMNIVQSDRGITATNEVNPLPLVDDWAVVSDGSIAVVRGQDYHVDWVNADGSISASPKISFDWQRLTDDDKAAVLDSARAAIEKQRAAATAQALSGKGVATDGGGGQRMVIMGMGGDAVIGGGGGGRSGSGAPTVAPVAMVDASELPDYRPVFGAGAVRADLDDNVWIRTSAARAGSIAGPIYDVVDRKGALVDRVQVPAGRQIIGFGKGGVVYMVARDGAASWIERTHR